MTGRKGQRYTQGKTGRKGQINTQGKTGKKDRDIHKERLGGKDRYIHKERLGGKTEIYTRKDWKERTEIYTRRIADCRNSTVKTREYIPPQFFQRYTALSRFARDLRSADPSLKTQIRFSMDDVRLWTKTKGTDEQFVEMEMEKVERIQKLPRIDHNAPWRKRADHPKWRRISPSQEAVVLRSLAGGCKDAAGGTSSSWQDDKQRHRVRSDSTEKETASSKKKRLSADSSSSSSSDSSAEDDSPSTGNKEQDKSMEVSS